LSAIYPNIETSELTDKSERRLLISAELYNKTKEPAVHLFDVCNLSKCLESTTNSKKVKQRSVDFTGIEENQIISGICKSFVIFQPTHLSRNMCESQEPPMCYQQKIIFNDGN